MTVEILIGLLGGILIGATGAGVGALVTPLLILAGYRAPVAIGTGIGVLVAAKSVGAFAHHQLGHWPGRQGWWLVTGGVAGVGLAWLLARAAVPVEPADVDTWLRHIVGWVLLAASLILLRTGWVVGGSGDNSKPPNLRFESLAKVQKHPSGLFVVGGGLGALVVVTSAGSGSLLGPLMMLMTEWNVPQLAAASNVFGWVVGVLGFGLHANLGHFNAALFSRVLVGLLPGVALGAVLSRRVPRRWFVVATGLASLLVAFRVLFS